MKVLFCRIGWCESYNGDINDKPVGGGLYNNSNIGFEIHNFKKECDNKYYGYVEVKGSINIEKIGSNSDGAFIDNVLVVWVSTNPKKGGQYIVGWYKDAIIYRDAKKIPANVKANRTITNANTDTYNIETEKAVLIQPISKRNVFPPIEGFGQSNIWYGTSELNENVVKWISTYEKNNNIN